jgi:hypothetical protein
MVTLCLWFEDRSDEVSNYSPWKERIMLVLMENDIWEFSNSIVAPPVDPKYLAAHKLKDVKHIKIILNGVKDHLIPHLSRKTTSRDVWEALKILFQSKNENHEMVLREKLRDMKMIGLDTVMTYLNRIRQV